MNEQIDILKDKATKIKQDLSKSAVKLHSKRKALAKNLEQSISRELRDLGMKNVIFKVEITIQEDLNGVEVNGKNCITERVSIT